MVKITRRKNETEAMEMTTKKIGNENTTGAENETDISGMQSTKSGIENNTDIEMTTENSDGKVDILPKKGAKTQPAKKPIAKEKKSVSGSKKSGERPKKKQPSAETPTTEPPIEPAIEPATEPVVAGAAEVRVEVEKQSPPKTGWSGVSYESSEYVSIQAMSALKGFTPLGMLFVLMDVLNGCEEGLIRVNRLANALSIGKPAMLVQLDNLENAGIIRTVSSSQRGRYIELLLPNPIAPRSQAQQEQPLALNVAPEGVPKNFSLEKLKALQDYLTERGIKVVSLPDETGLDPRIAQLAAFLGKYFAWIKPFYARLKSTLSLGEEIRFSLTGFHSRKVTHTLNFCKMLKDIGFLASFTYHRAPLCEVAARINRVPASINFLSGGWLEHYIRDRVTAVLATHPSTIEEPFAFMKNPQILLPGDEDFEFDFLLMVADTVFWIEAKTGEYMDYIGKYARVSQLLGLNRNTNFLVIADAPKPDSNISARYGLSCCSVDEFSEVFRLALVRELGRIRRHCK